MRVPRFQKSNDGGIDSHDATRVRLSGFRYCRAASRVASLHGSSKGICMPNRREFLRESLQTGAAVSAIAANGMISGTAAAVGSSRRLALGRALYDDRY